MIAIKMDMPKSCSECHFLDTGIRVNVCKLLDEKVENISNARRWNCPLIALPEENKDMSWEELVEKIKLIHKKEYNIINNQIIWFENWNIGFHKDGDITSDYEGGDTFITNYKKATYFQMWVIIKALIGDER